MAQGTVKWFNPTKGYGFIQPSGGGKDVFVHISAVERAGLSTLNEGQQITYEVVANRGKVGSPNTNHGTRQAAATRNMAPSISAVRYGSRRSSWMTTRRKPGGSIACRRTKRPRGVSKF